MGWKDVDEPMLRARWDELHEVREKILAVATPLRQARDSLVQDSAARIKALDVSIREAEKGLYEIENERAHIARKLGAKSLRVR